MRKIALNISPAGLLFEATGRDVKRYFQNRLSQDISKISSEPLWGAALSPQGKTDLLLQIQGVEENRFLIYVEPPLSKDEALSILLKFKVADHVILNLKEIKRCIHLVGWDGDYGGGIPFKRNRTGSPGVDLLFETDLFSPHLTAFIENYLISKEEGEFLRIVSGIPAYPSEINPSLILAESNFKESYSTSKGCYVGQEVLQKIDSFAKLPYIQTPLVSEGEFSIEPDEKVYVNGSPVGTVLSASKFNGKTAAFVRIKESLKSNSYQIGEGQFKPVEN